MFVKQLLPLAGLVLSTLACEACEGPRDKDVVLTRLRPRMQPDALGAASTPRGPLSWGQLNVLHTTDTHGWLEGHIKEQNYGADWGDFISFVKHMNQTAINNNVDFLLVDTGDLHDGAGLSDATTVNGNISNAIFENLKYDLLTIGNHELYVTNIAYETFSNFSKVYGDRYLTSNVQIMDPVTGNWDYIGNQYRYFTTRMGLRVMAFGFLYDFTGNSNVSRVIHANATIAQPWFSQAVNFDQPIDMFIMLGHNPPRSTVSGSTFGTYYNAIRKMRPDVPIQVFGGHTHVRDFVVYDTMATGLESGRYCETVGWFAMNGFKAGNFSSSGPAGLPHPNQPAVSVKVASTTLSSTVPLDTATALPTETASPSTGAVATAGSSANYTYMYFRRYLDWNRLTFEFHANGSQSGYSSSASGSGSGSTTSFCSTQTVTTTLSPTGSLPVVTVTVTAGASNGSSSSSSHSSSVSVSAPPVSGSSSTSASHTASSSTVSAVSGSASSSASHPVTSTAGSTTPVVAVSTSQLNISSSATTTTHALSTTVTIPTSVFATTSSAIACPSGYSSWAGFPVPTGWPHEGFPGFAAGAPCFATEYAGYPTAYPPGLPKAYPTGFPGWPEQPWAEHSAGGAWKRQLPAASASIFDTPQGVSISNQIYQDRQLLNLTNLYGCAPQSWCQSCAPFLSSGNIFSLLSEALAAIVYIPSRQTVPRIILLNTGSVRFDLFQGPFTYDDSFIVSPFTDTFQYIPDVPYEYAEGLQTLLNHGSVYKRDEPHAEPELTARSFDFDPFKLMQRDTCVDPPITHDHLSKRSHAGGRIIRRQSTAMDPGYTTTDDFGTDGDDTIHTKIPYYSQPNYFQSNVSFPANGSTPATLDVIFLNYFASSVVMFLQQQGYTNVSASSVQQYLPVSFTTNSYLPAYAKIAPDWQANVPNCPLNAAGNY